LEHADELHQRGGQPVETMRVNHGKRGRETPEFAVGDANANFLLLRFSNNTAQNSPQPRHIQAKRSFFSAEGYAPSQIPALLDPTSCCKPSLLQDLPVRPLHNSSRIYVYWSKTEFICKMAVKTVCMGGVHVCLRVRVLNLNCTTSDLDI